MNAREFASRWKREKDAYLALVRGGGGLAAKQFLALGLSVEQQAQLWVALDSALTDVFYTLLLGLDGCAQLGGVQETFRIYDEAGNLISDCGELEAAAYEQFQAEP